MRIVIMGGGKLGYYLATNMLEKKHDVRLIEKNRIKSMGLANKLDVEVICGDGSEITVLEHAGTRNCDCFIAVTGSDQDNLVASQIAKKEFMAHKVIARANNPRNMEALRNLGADIALDGIMLKDITLPKGSLIISVLRNDVMMIPNGFTVIHAGDEIVAVCEGKSQKQLTKILSSKR